MRRVHIHVNEATLWSSHLRKLDELTSPRVLQRKLGRIYRPFGTKNCVTVDITVLQFYKIGLADLATAHPPALRPKEHFVSCYSTWKSQRAQGRTHFVLEHWNYGKAGRRHRTQFRQTGSISCFSSSPLLLVGHPPSLPSFLEGLGTFEMRTYNGLLPYSIVQSINTRGDTFGLTRSSQKKYLRRASHKHEILLCIIDSSIVTHKHKA